MVFFKIGFKIFGWYSCTEWKSIIDLNVVSVYISYTGIFMIYFSFVKVALIYVKVM